MLSIAATLLTACGCYAPLHSPGVSARCLPDEYRTPYRTMGPPLNYASLTMARQADYMLGPDDIVEVIVNGLYQDTEVHPVKAQIMANGDVILPIVGAVNIGGMNLSQAQVAITKAFADGFIKDARVNVTLAERSVTNIVVLGEVTKPGVYPMPKYENDIAHALAMAGGLTPEAGRTIEVHRRVGAGEAQRAAVLEELQSQEKGGVVMLPPVDRPDHKFVAPAPNNTGDESTIQTVSGEQPTRITKIPLMGFAPQPIHPEDIILHSGDVVVIGKRRADVFYVVGKLSTNNTVRFSLGVKERELGAAFVLPPDREVDVVSAVAMAGYIDPIDSPTTVTVHRIQPDGRPLLVHVDLIKARYDRRETILVRSEDIIYLNPDAAWWSRRTFNAIVSSFFSFRIGYAIPNSPSQ